LAERAVVHLPATVSRYREARLPGNGGQPHYQFLRNITECRTAQHGDIPIGDISGAVVAWP
jgi:hypothetical protein